MADPTLDEDSELVPGLKYVKKLVEVLPAPASFNNVPTPAKVDLENLHPDLKERLDYAAKDWLANKELNPKGEPFPISSAYRNTAQQSRLFANRASNPNLVAAPGYSSHEKGMGVDILPHVPDTFLANYGLHRPYGKKDAVHVEINPSAPWAKPDTDYTDEEGVDVPGAQYTQRQGVYTPTVSETMSQQFAGLGKDVGSAEYWTKTLPKQTAALADLAYGSLPAAAKFVGEPFAKLIDKVGGTTAATEALEKLTTFADRPIGKAFGITNDPAYNAEAANRFMNFVGENMDKGADYISKETGMPKSDVQWFMNAALIKAAPAVAKGGKKVIKAGAETLPKVGEQLQGQFEAAKAKIKEKVPGIMPEENPNLRSVGASELSQARLRQENANSLLEPIQLSRDQATRKFEDVNYAREKAKEPEVGAPLRAHYAEQNAKVIRNFDREIEATGAQKTGIERGELGQNLNDVIANYQKNRYQQVQDAYKLADEAGETLQQVPYKAITDYIDNIKSKRPTQYDQNPILKMVEEDLKSNDPNKTGAINLRQYEDIRQLINGETEYGTSNGFHGGEIKKAIDKATKDAGGTLYKEARALNSSYMKQFEENPAIRDITAIKKGTTERKIAVEDLVENSMLKGPRSRVEELFKTLEEAGPEGQQMINELRGVVAEHIKNEATKSTQLDINGNPIVSPAKLDPIIKKLDKSGKLDLIFGKEGAARYRTLNDVTKDIYTVPPGSVNTSNTAANLKSYAADMAATYALSGVPAPAAHLLKMGKEEVVKRRDLNRINEFINYGKENK
jgi:DNA-directed RNA polymerase subunit F